jgi:hypothetical protein
MSGPSESLVVAIKLQDKLGFEQWACYFAFYKELTQDVAIHNFRILAASITPTSQVCVSLMLSLTVGN